jgi:hypothetical protein
MECGGFSRRGPALEQECRFDWETIKGGGHVRPH